MVFMQYFKLLVPSLLALGLPLAAIAKICDQNNVPSSMHVSGYYPGYASNDIPPGEIPFQKITDLFVAFAVTTNNVAELSLDDNTAKALPEVVRLGKSNNVKVYLSVGGATGSQYFSIGVAPENTTAFVKAIVGLADRYDLDGIDIDWEFPNRDMGCNTRSASDTDNFLAFAKELKTALGPDRTLSAAVGVELWNGADGNPLTARDVSATAADFAKVLDHITIMTYDIFGGWSKLSGPNAPMDDTCAPANGQVAAIKSAVTTWTNAKFSPQQISVGVAAYGHSYFVKPADAYSSSGHLTFYAAVDSAQQPLGPGDPPPGVDPGKDQCGKPNTASGVFTFSQLITQGFLTTDGTNAPGIDYTFENCSQTAILYNKTSNVLISCDNAPSMAVKGNYVKEQNLRGINMWAIGGDSNDILLDAFSGGMGVQQCT